MTERQAAAKAKLAVAKLDRLSRNLAFLAKLIESGVTFVAADMPHANIMTLQVLAVFAEQRAARQSGASVRREQ